MTRKGIGIFTCRLEETRTFILEGNSSFFALLNAPPCKEADLEDLLLEAGCDWNEVESINQRLRLSGFFDSVLEMENTGQPAVSLEIRITKSLSSEEEGKVFTGLLRDVSEEDRELIEHGHQEEELISILDSTRDLIARFDLEQRHVFVNQALAEVAGLSREEYLGKTNEELGMPEELCRYWRESVEEVVRTRQDKLIDFKFHRADGKPVHIQTRVTPQFDERGEVIGTICVGRDVTELKTVEEALRGSEGRIRLLLEQIPAVFWSTDRDLVFTSSAGAGLEAIDSSAEENLGISLYEYFETDDPAHPAISKHLDALKGKSSTYEFPYQDRVFSSHVQPLRQADGEIIGVVGIALDITDKVKAEAERHALEDRIGQKQKLESLGLMAGGIAHDFNNLLVAILGNAGLAKTEVDEETTARELIVSIEKSAIQAADLTNQLLAYSGKGRFLIERINLNALIRDMVHLLRISIGQQAFLKLELDDSIKAIKASKSQICQIIMNLVINAAEAIDGRVSVITIRTGTFQVDEEYLKKAWLPDHQERGEHVFLDVLDNGPGMSKETMARIFDPFYTTKFVGRGLGLAVVMGVVRSHHGTLHVESTEGEGTLFRVTFPAIASPPEEEEEQEPTGEISKLREGPATILLIDDEPAVRETAGRILEIAGYKALAAASGAEGIEVMENHRGEVDGVILDLTMPGMSGEETFRQLRKIDPTLPILLMSGYSEEEVVSRFEDHEPTGFLQKPFRAKQLIKKLNEAFGF